MDIFTSSWMAFQWMSHMEEYRTRCFFLNTINSKQFYMCCSTARHCWALTRSTHPHSHEYTDMQPFVMHHFQGCRASLESLCINFGGELSTIATMMFAMLHVLLNDLVRSLIFHWVYMILFIQQFWNVHQIRMISTIIHSFKLNFHNFVHLTTSNLEINLDDLYI